MAYYSAQSRSDHENGLLLEAFEGKTSEMLTGNSSPAGPKALREDLASLQGQLLSASETLAQWPVESQTDTKTYSNNVYNGSTFHQQEMLPYQHARKEGLAPTSLQNTQHPTDMLDYTDGLQRLEYQQKQQHQQQHQQKHQQKHPKLLRCLGGNK